MTFDSALDISVAVETATKDAVELEQYRDGAATNSNLGKTGDITENHASGEHGMDILLMNTGSDVNRKYTPSQHASQMEDQGGNSSRSNTGGEHTCSQRTPVHILEDM